MNFIPKDGTELTLRRSDESTRWEGGRKKILPTSQPRLQVERLATNKTARRARHHPGGPCRSHEHIASSWQ